MKHLVLVAALAAVSACSEAPAPAEPAAVEEPAGAAPAATLAADQRGDGRTISAPNGVVLDGIEYWNAGRPLYDPAKIKAPLLITVGELANDTPPYMGQTIFPLATAGPWKRLAVLGGGTHTMLMERNRMLLFRTVQQFLEEAPPGKDALA